MKKVKKKGSGQNMLNILKLSKIKYGDEKSEKKKGRGQNMSEYTKTKLNLIWRKTFLKLNLT